MMLFNGTFPVDYSFHQIDFDSSFHEMFISTINSIILAPPPSIYTNITFLRWLSVSVNVHQFLQLHSVSTEQPPVHHQDPGLEQVSQRQPVEDLCEQIPHLLRILRSHFPFKPIHLVHVDTLVVTCSGEGVKIESQLINISVKKGLKKIHQPS